MAPELSYGWLHEHKHKHRHKHRDRRGEEGAAEGGGAGGTGLSGGTGLGGTGRGGGGVMDSLHRYRYGKDPSAPPAGGGNLVTTPPANSPSSSSSSSAERYKRKDAPFPCLGPSYLSAGGGARGYHHQESWLRRGSPEVDYANFSKKANPGPDSFAAGRLPDPEGCSDSEEDEEPLTPLSGSAPSHAVPQHTNLFASALSRSASRGGRGRRGGSAAPGLTRSFMGLDGTLRKDRPLVS